MNIIFIYNQYFNKMEKILLSFVSTFGSATSQDTIGAVSIILIGLPLLIILYRILKWILIVNEKMSVLREVVQSYKQIQEEKEKEIKKTSQTSDIDDGARDSRFVESTIVTSTEINSIEKILAIILLSQILVRIL